MHYIEFDNMLASLSNRAANASESHGHLVGLYTTKPLTAVDEWLATLAGDANADSAALNAQLGPEATRLVGLLQADDLRFRLVLPDDDVALPERAAALAQWCQGYLYGLAQGGIRQFDGLPGDCSEILRDFVELTRAGSDDASEESESDFFEITEYVRVGVQLIFEELNELANAAAEQAH